MDTSAVVGQLHRTISLLLGVLVNLSADDRFRSSSKSAILSIFGMAYPVSRFKPLVDGGHLHLKPRLPPAIQSLAMKLVTNLTHSPTHRSLVYRSELAHRARIARSEHKRTWAVDEEDWRLKQADRTAAVIDASSTDSEVDDPLIDA